MLTSETAVIVGELIYVMAFFLSFILGAILFLAESRKQKVIRAVLGFSLLGFLFAVSLYLRRFFCTL